MSTITAKFDKAPVTAPAIQPAKTDAAAPKTLIVEIKDVHGVSWGTFVAPQRVFSTGSFGFNANGKVVNPANGEAYQVGSNITLVGSSPAAAAKAAAAKAAKATK